MADALARSNPRSAGLAVPGEQAYFTREQIDLIKDQIAKGATDGELALFVKTCERMRLDPFARQIFLVKRWDASIRREVATPQVSIDGFRLVADRTGMYEGQTPPQWCAEDGAWRDVWLVGNGKPPAAARVGVYRRGFREPIWGTARYESFVQTKKEGGPNRMWATMPDIMLAKCAEAQALRKAFPNDLGGVYTDDELPETAEIAGASHSSEVRALGAALHEVSPAPDGDDPLAHVMVALADVHDEIAFEAWVAKYYVEIAREPDSKRKRDRWDTIKSRGGGLVPPIRVGPIRQMFAEHAAKAAAAAKAASQPDVIEGERDPVDELQSVETAEMLLAWARDHREWLAAIPQNSEHEREVWDAIRRASAKVGDGSLSDQINEMIS